MFSHGDVEFLTPEHPDYRAHLTNHYGSSPSSWGDDIVYCRLQLGGWSRLPSTRRRFCTTRRSQNHEVKANPARAFTSLSQSASAHWLHVRSADRPSACDFLMAPESLASSAGVAVSGPGELLPVPVRVDRPDRGLLARSGGPSGRLAGSAAPTPPSSARQRLRHSSLCRVPGPSPGTRPALTAHRTRQDNLHRQHPGVAQPIRTSPAAPLCRLPLEVDGACTMALSTKFTALSPPALPGVGLASWNLSYGCNSWSGSHVRTRQQQLGDRGSFSCSP